MTTARPQARAARKPQSQFVQVLVALRGVEIENETGAPMDRQARLNAMKAHSKAAREAVLAWLREQGVKGSYKHVSQPTAFGSFTLECTPEVMRLLRRAPGVASVTRVNDVPLQLID